MSSSSSDHDLALQQAKKEAKEGAAPQLDAASKDQYKLSDKVYCQYCGKPFFEGQDETAEQHFKNNPSHGTADKMASGYTLVKQAATDQPQPVTS